MEISGDSGHSEPGPNWWPEDFLEKFQSAAVSPGEEALPSRGTKYNVEKTELSSETASQVLWSTGTLSSPIPNGFYSIIPDKKLKELFDAIPSLDDLYCLGVEGFKAVILVDAEKDKKLSMLKQLSAALVKGLNTNPALLIKKIAGLVFDFYKRPHPELSPAKSAVEDTSYLMENRGIQLLGQIRHGSCWPRAILFKVLADSVGLESKLMVGLSSDGSVECADSYKHMSVVVVLNSVELLVDLMRFPGQLIPFSTKAIFISHISAEGESDSAENDSCDSPLEPNSPLCGVSDRMDGEGPEYDENLQSLYQRRLDASSNPSSPGLRNTIMRLTIFSEGKLSVSHSEPNIANAFWRRSRRKVVAEQQRTASSSPEHPLFRARGRSMLSGDRQSFREYAEGVAASRSVGASTSDVRRTRRRSISITPEIGDDIVRAVRAMNETLKQNRLLRDPEGSSYSSSEKNLNNSTKNGEVSGCMSGAYNISRKQTNSTQKAMSLPSSPHEFRGQTSESGGTSDFLRTEDLLSTWNRVLQSSPFLNKPLLPFELWNVDFSELTVGTRVGIGKFLWRSFPGHMEWY
ncbi:ATP binding protein [Iris pallida]|uniref:ATP binding protein n=1 Tax=Iris pallida TaxID=29817 RepID=A0AAX6GQV8_IRIPA|nr:ATP binding protein [Iris pallida]KAJ6851855.1 ATP binding protein [Iris pallida]